MIAYDATLKLEEMKIAIFLHIGEDAINKFSLLDLNDGDRKMHLKVLEAFVKYCLPERK